jgi:O-antigen ligase
MFPSLRRPESIGWGFWDYAHSTILEITFEMGIPIAAMIVIAAVASLIILGSAAVRSTDRSRSTLSAVTGIAVLSYLHSMIDFSLQIPGYLIMFAIMLGCGLARASAEQGRASQNVVAEVFSSEAGPGSRQDVSKQKARAPVLIQSDRKWL